MECYPILKYKVTERGIKQKAIAEALGITVRTLYKKMHGITPFTWNEVCALQTIFFPDVDKDVLFAWRFAMA